MKMLLSVLGCLLVAGVALGQPMPGAPPQFRVVTKTDAAKGYLQYRDFEHAFVPVMVTRKVIKNGVEVTEIVTETQTVVKETIRQMDMTQSRVITPDGKQLPIDEVWKRVKADSVIVLSTDGNTPAAPFLRALSAETIVVIRVIPKMPVAPAPK